MGGGIGRQRFFAKRAAGWIRLSPDAQEALDAIRDRDGVTVDEAVARALLSWAGRCPGAAGSA